MEKRSLPEVWNEKPEVPPGGSPSFQRPLTKKELESEQAKNEMNIKRDNQALARFLVKWILLVLGVAYIAYQVIGFFVPEGKVNTMAGVSDKVLPILQSVLFTLVGFLVGDKIAQK
jgi:hypothetical protein